MKKLPMTCRGTWTATRLARCCGRLALLVVVTSMAQGCIVVSKDAYDRDLKGMKQQADWLEGQKRDLHKDREAWKAKHEASAKNAQKCQSDRTAVEAELKSTRDKLRELAKNCGKAGALLTQCEDELQAARANYTILKDKYAKLESRLSAVQKQLDALRDSIASVKKRLAALARAGKLRVVVKNGFLVIQLQSDILFDTGKSKLKGAAGPVLKELADVLVKFEGKRFQVAGHTDPRGNDMLNWKLSTARSLAVVEFLIKSANVPPAMLSAGGYGSYLPVAENDTEEGMRANRRVEFLLLPDLTELLKLAGLKSTDK